METNRFLNRSGSIGWLIAFAALVWFLGSVLLLSNIGADDAGIFSIVATLLFPLIPLLSRSVLSGSAKLFWMFLTSIFFLTCLASAFGLIEFSEGGFLLISTAALALFYALLATALVSNSPFQNPKEPQNIWDRLPLLADSQSFPAIFELTKEARRMRLVSYLALFLIGVLIFIAGVVFLFAGSITSLDLRSDNMVTSISAEMQETKAELSALQNTLLINLGGAPRIKLTVDKCDSGIAGSGDESNEAAQRCDDARRALTEGEEIIKVTKAGIAFLSERYRKLQIDLDEARKEVYKESEDGDDVAPLVASSVTRFGVVIILMFFVQSLSNLYRYTLRLSSLYKARSIALLISHEDSSRLEKANKFLAVDTVVYGREPKTVAEEANRIIDVIGRHFSKASSKVKDDKQT